MKYTIILLFILALVKAEAQPMFRRTYGFGLVNEGKCAIQTYDHGYAIAGSTTPGWGGQTDAYLIKTDSLGNAIYQYSYGSIGIEKANAILQLPDSGFLLAGYSNGYSANNDYDILIIRTDKNGNQQWLHTFGTNDWDFINDMQFTPDGNCILSGYSYGSGNGSSAGYVAKMDINGNILWQKFFTDTEDVVLNKIAPKADGSLTVCGTLKNQTTGSTDGLVLFLNDTGDSLRSSIYNNPGNKESFAAIGYLSNGNVIIAGTSEDSTGNKDELIIRMDTTGTNIWVSIAAHPGRDENNALVIMNDTIITAGNTTSSGQGQDEFHIVQFFDYGGFGAANTYGGSEHEFAYSVLIANDGGYVLTGTSNSYGPGQQSVFFVKSDRAFTFDPNVTINVNEIESSAMSVYPNPSSGNITVTASQKINECNLFVYEQSGRIILEKKSSLPAQIEIDQPGFYIVEILGKTFMNSGR